jgi:hypothetical protein
MEFQASNPQRSDVEEKIWQFLRGDLPPVEFEEWVQSTPALETLLGNNLFLQLLSADYRNWFGAAEISESLETWVDAHYPRNCDCITWANDEKFPVHSDTANLLIGFETPKDRTPWLKLIRCVHCRSHWYLGEDAGDDWYYLHRLKDEEAERILSLIEERRLNMNGAQTLFKALTDVGLDTCFANPGTSEMQLIYEMGRTKDTHVVLCPEENVVTGAADGYARMTGKPAFTLLHERAASIGGP